MSGADSSARGRQVFGRAEAAERHESEIDRLRFIAEAEAARAAKYRSRWLGSVTGEHGRAPEHRLGELERERFQLEAEIAALRAVEARLHEVLSSESWRIGASIVRTWRRTADLAERALGRSAPAPAAPHAAAA